MTNQNRNERKKLMNLGRNIIAIYFEFSKHNRIEFNLDPATLGFFRFS